MSRLMHRLAALDDSFEGSVLELDQPPIAMNKSSIEQRAQSLGIRLNHRSRKCISYFLHNEHPIAKLETNKQKFNAKKDSLLYELETIEKHLHEHPTTLSSIEELNRNLLISLRSLLNNPIYHALSFNEDHAFINLVHTLVLNQYTKTDLLPIFEHLGQNVTPIAHNHPLAEQIAPIREHLKTIIGSNTLINIAQKYSFQELFALTQSFISQVTQNFSLEFPKAGDDRLAFSNTPGKFFTEKRLCQTLSTIITPAPVHNNQIVPEFLAALQALENHQFIPSCPLPCAWIYSNLQTFTFPQKQSSLLLMKLKTQFPLSFFPITVPQDKTLKGITFSPKDRNKQIAHLFHPKNFTLKLRGLPHDQEYFLPNEYKDHPQLQQLAHATFDLIKKHRAHHSAILLKRAFHELFHLSLIRFHEQSSLNLLAKKTNNRALHVLRSTACTFSVDRGAKMNAFSYYASRKKPKPSPLIGSFFGRPLLTFRRLPQQKRVHQLTPLLRVVPHKDLYKHIHQIDTIVASK